MKDAERLWTTSAGFFISALALTNINPDRAFNGEHSASIWLLVGNAAEISTKAAFLALGGDAEVLKYGFGHDLEKTLAGAVTLGFQPGSDFGELIGHLQVPHKNHHFRYLEQADPRLPQDMEWVFSTLRAHLSQIFRLIYA